MKHFVNPISSKSGSANPGPGSELLANHRPGLWASVASLVASFGTLVCCALCPRC